MAGGGYPYLTVNAYNTWALVPGDTGNSLANAGLWVCDAVRGSPTKCGVGRRDVRGHPGGRSSGPSCSSRRSSRVLWPSSRRPDRLTILVALAVLALAFFAVPTRVHERYASRSSPSALILVAVSWRWRIAYVVAVRRPTFLNMYVVLTTLYPDNPAISDWLGIGPAIRSEVGVALIAIAATRSCSLWALAPAAVGRAGDRSSRELRPPPAPTTPRAGTTRPAPDARPASRRRPSRRARGALTAGDCAPAAAARALVGPAACRGRRRDADLDASAARRGSRPRRLVPRAARGPADPRRPSAQRSHEGGGRLDRLDLWLLVVLVVATLGLRTFRLAEPYQMHFDEVYHARTATEFLQGWRYGLTHDIYEWTHPHLAKYAMAGGLVLWGEDDVSATSELDCRSWPRPSSRAGRTSSRRATGPASGSTSRPARRSGPTTCGRAQLISDDRRARARPRWPSTRPRAS